MAVSDERTRPLPNNRAGESARLACAHAHPGPGTEANPESRAGFADLSRLFHLSLTELESLNFPAPSAQFLFSGKARTEAEQELVRVREQSGAILTYEDEDYPERLREIFDPPPVLWALGDVKLLARPAIAIVGTRHPTPYGTGMAEVLARDLASRRMVILSGMARGIDTAAHRGALAAKRQHRGRLGHRHRRDLP